MYGAGQSSSESGYTSGAQTRIPPAPAFATNVIDKFPFAADANATDVGDLTQARMAAAGQSGTGQWLHFRRTFRRLASDSI